jgi:hypothetical protein
LYNVLSTGELWDVSAPIWGVTPTLRSYGVRNPDAFWKLKAGVEEMLSKMPDDHKRYILGTHLCLRVEVGGNLYMVSHSGVTTSRVQNAISAVGIRDDDEDPDIDTLMEWMAVHDEEAFYFGYPKFREGQKTNLYKFPGACQIFGHQIVQSPILCPDYIGIDTGCGTTDPNQLTAVILPTREIVQVP